MTVSAIRGAISVPVNSEKAILAASRELVSVTMTANKLESDAIISIIFVITPDLDAAFPARGARSLGLDDVPLLDMVSPSVVGSMPGVIRMLLTCESSIARADIRHVYLGEARALRPDLAVNGGEQA